MKKILLLLSALFFFSQNIFSQSTWVRTLSVAPIQATITNHPESVGPHEFTINTDNTIVGIYTMSKNAETSIIKINSSGVKLWEYPAGVTGGIYSESCSGLQSTPDNGNIFMFIHNGGSVFNSIKKLDSNGNIEWIKERDILSGGGIFQSALPTSYSTILIEINDSLQEYDLNGSLIRSRTPFSGLKAVFSDSSFLWYDGNQIQRESFSGNVQWNTPLSNNYFYLADSAFSYFVKQDSLTKINSVNGNIVWTKYFSFGVICPTSDGGIIRSKYGTPNVGELSKFDSSLNLLWSKQYLLPSYGFSQVKEISPNSILAGGSWESNNIYSMVNNQNTSYSPFITLLDSLGHGNFDSTDFYYPGNANDNLIYDWADDAVYIAAALNTNGIPRDQVIQTQAGYYQNVIGENWVQNFPGSINYKFSDIDGNGTIDTVDLRKFANVNASMPRQIPSHWQRSNNSNSIGDLQLKFRNHQLNDGDTAIVDVILGNNVNQIDSIYGISLETSLRSQTTGFVNWVPILSQIHNSNLGDTAIDLFANSYFYSFISSTPVKSVLCRTDHTNRVIAGDTIITMTFLVINSNPFSDSVYLYTLANAITEAGYPLSLNIIGDTLFVNANTTGIKENTFQTISVYPNPANETINISVDRSIETNYKIFDQYGKLIDSFSANEKVMVINVRNYLPGTYVIIGKSQLCTFEKSFVVVH